MPSKKKKPAQPGGHSKNKKVFARNSTKPSTKNQGDLTDCALEVIALAHALDDIQNEIYQLGKKAPGDPARLAGV